MISQHRALLQSACRPELVKRLLMVVPCAGARHNVRIPVEHLYAAVTESPTAQSVISHFICAKLAKTSLSPTPDLVQLEV